MKPLVYVDCDGVLADFLGHALREAANYGHHVARENCTTWDFIDAWPARVRERVRARMNDPQWWRALPVLPGAREALEMLDEVADVIIVTAPWETCGVWATTRTTWLGRHLAVNPRRALIGAPKFALGDGVMIEDKASTLRDWHDRQSMPAQRMGVLIEHPYNAHETLGPRAIARAPNVLEAAAKVRAAILAARRELTTTPDGVRVEA